MAGRPKTFARKDEIVSLYQEFCDDIVANGYRVAPTMTEYARWIADRKGGCDRRTIYLTLNRYYPDVKRDIEAIRADVIAQGTMLGAYNASMSIFALKNWCNWTDKQEVKAEQTVTLSDAVKDVEAIVETMIR